MAGGKFKRLDLMAINPRDEQFEPTVAQPIRQRARMGGDPVGDYPEAEASPGEQFREKVQKVNEKTEPPSRKKAEEAIRTINDSTVGPTRKTDYQRAFEK